MNCAFVAGATGYTGREVVRVLCAEGVRTVAHVRPESPRLGEYRERFAALGAEVDVSPWEEAAIDAALARVRPTLVFALLGITRRGAAAEARATGRKASYQSVDYGLTAMLLRAAQAIEPAPRFVYLSAANVGAGSYGAARAQAERDIEASGLPHLIARASLITGPDRDEGRPLERAGAVVLDGALGLAGVFGARRLRDRFQSLTGAELASGLVRLALAGRDGVVYSEALRR